ncbi:MAG: M16 family metallopeptidase [Candidatus Methylacidiphilales bacterium]|nr:pitrilysin family protein [Candidatus Methylacidiphilales bacterium]
MVFTVERLSCGAGLAVAEMPHVPSVAVGLWLGVGGRHEDKRVNGISHFLEHLLFKGTGKRNALEISEAIEGVGGRLNAFTAEEMTCYYARASAKHLPLVLDVLTDMLRNANFPAHEIERERGVITEEIKMYEDHPEQVAMERLSTLLWPNHPLGRSLCGSVKTVSSLQQQDFIDFRDRHYHGGNLWITAAGNTNLREVKELLSPLLAGIAGGEPSPYKSGATRQLQPRISVVNKPIEQTHVAMALRSVSRHDPRKFALRLLSVILGENMSSRLFQTIREEHGLAYSVDSSVSYLHDAGTLSINVGLDSDKLPKALDLIFKALQVLSINPPSARELHRAKEYTVGQTQLSLESTVNQMMWLGDHALGHGRVLDPSKVLGQIEAVTAEEIRQMAELVTTRRNLSLSIVSPELKLGDVEKMVTLG